METITLLLVTLGMLASIVGLFFLIFVVLGKNKGTDGGENCSTSKAQSFTCGCGTKPCGLPIKE